MSRAGSIIEIRWNYDHDDFDYTAPVETMENFFRGEKGNREKLAKYFEELAEKCRKGDWPFRLLMTEEPT